MTSFFQPLVIVEPEPGGHHFIPYVQFLLRGLQSTERFVVLLTSQTASQHPAFLSLQAEFGDWLQIEASLIRHRAKGTGSLALLIAQWRQFRLLKSAAKSTIKKYQPRAFLLMCADQMDRMLGLLGSPFHGAAFFTRYIQAKFHWPELGIAPQVRHARLSRYLFERAQRIRSHRKALSIDQTLVALSPELSKPPQDGLTRPVGFIPDPGEVKGFLPKAKARAALQLPDAKKVILIYGGISARKNPAALLKAIQSPEFLECVVYVAGNFEAPMEELFAGSAWQTLRSTGHLVVENGFVDSEREKLLFNAADLVWVGYSKGFYGQSAVLAQAASKGLPVLAKSEGLIGQLVQQYGIGLCFDPDNTQAVRAAISALNSDAARAHFQDACGNFAEEHSQNAYIKAWLYHLSLV